MAEASRYRLLQLPRSADELQSTRDVPGRGYPSLAAATQPTQPEWCYHLGTDEEARRRLAPKTAHPTPLAQQALRRPSPEVGAVCGKAARTDLCGGREVTRVPTATKAECGDASAVESRSGVPELRVARSIRAAGGG